ncbi:MAG: flagellar biosynthesis protein FlhB [Lachnospiraceae bacterium]
MSLQYNLQYFAKDGPGGEKTEAATQKKIEDSRKEGQVAKSKEIANGLGLLSLFLVLKYWIGNMGRSFLEFFSEVYNRVPDAVNLLGGTSPQLILNVILQRAIIMLLQILLPIFLVGFLVAFISDYIQVKWKPTSKPLKPKFSKLNPISGIKKIISINSIVELIKSFAKLGVIAYVTYKYLEDKLNVFYLLYDISLVQAIALVGEIVIGLGIQISCVYMIIALSDFIFQKWKHAKDLRMTKQEVKEEYKNQEGDPQIKGKIKQKMREASMRRMMQSLPEADVVITNPTHYAVAIKYAPEEHSAPLVIAKGQDALALRIREKAKEYNVEIVENKPLARMLFANVEVGELVPPELYQAVAEVLAMVYHMQGKMEQ